MIFSESCFFKKNILFRWKFLWIVLKALCNINIVQITHMASSLTKYVINIAQKSDLGLSFPKVL